MPRPELELNPYAESIITLYAYGVTFPQIIKHIEREYGLKVGRKTLQRRLADWQVPPRQVRTRVTDELIEELRALFFRLCPSHDQLFSMLRQDFTISRRGITTLRQSLGIYRRLEGDRLEHARLALLRFFETPSEDSHLIPTLGRRSGYHFIRQQALLHIPERPLFQALCEYYPRELQERLRRVRAKRGGFTVPGPNYTWSVDGYCKLKDYGFEVYAACDAYSRFIPWAFTGHSNGTGRSVLLQYLTVVGVHGFIPLNMRSDHGVETPMMAAAHYWLSMASTEARMIRPRRTVDGYIEFFMPARDNFPEVRITRDDLHYQAPPMFGPDRPFRFTDCWTYGTSMRNQRIESWWRRLADARTGFWRQYFKSLKDQDLWDEAHMADRVAMLFTFMVPVRQSVAKFVDQWNSHYIRKQRNREHHQAGKPWVMYFVPDPLTAIPCQVPLNHQRWQALFDIVKGDGIDHDKYLPDSMMNLCESIMATFRPIPRVNVDHTMPYFEEYLHLRSALQEHENQQLEPQLELLPKPTGGWEVFERRMREDGVHVDEIRQHLETANE